MQSKRRYIEFAVIAVLILVGSVVAMKMGSSEGAKMVQQLSGAGR